MRAFFARSSLNTENLLPGFLQVEPCFTTKKDFWFPLYYPQQLNYKDLEEIPDYLIHFAWVRNTFLDFLLSCLLFD